MEYKRMKTWHELELAEVWGFPGVSPGLFLGLHHGLDPQFTILRSADAPVLWMAEGSGGWRVLR